MHKQVLLEIRGIEFYCEEEEILSVSGMAYLDKPLPRALLCHAAPASVVDGGDKKINVR